MTKTKTETTIEPSKPLDEVCYVCDRFCFGEIVCVGFGHWRHNHCGIGSEDWELYYQRQSENSKHILSEFHDYLTTKVIT